MNGLKSFSSSLSSLEEIFSASHSLAFIPPSSTPHTTHPSPTSSTPVNAPLYNHNDDIPFTPTHLHSLDSNSTNTNPSTPLFLPLSPQTPNSLDFTRASLSLGQESATLGELQCPSFPLSSS